MTQNQPLGHSGVVTPLQPPSPKSLWALHLLGPDDVHAAPSMEAAALAAARVNGFFAGTGPNFPKPNAIATLWTGTAEAHAADVVRWPLLFGMHEPAEPLITSGVDSGVDTSTATAVAERLAAAPIPQQPVAEGAGREAVGAQIVGWVHEDQLPDGYPYDAMFAHSKVDGVRMFPVFAPTPAPTPAADAGGPERDGVQFIFDIDAMLRDCIPGGDSCDPQLVADSIRLWFDVEYVNTYLSPDRWPDNRAVDRFAVAMKRKLGEARAKGRGGWDGPTCNAQMLSDMLRHHVAKGDPLDVANFCMFLHQRGEAILPVDLAHGAPPSPANVTLAQVDREFITPFESLRSALARAEQHRAEAVACRQYLEAAVEVLAPPDLAAPVIALANGATNKLDFDRTLRGLLRRNCDQDSSAVVVKPELTTADADPETSSPVTPESSEVLVTVAGPRACGKSSIALLIIDALRELGLACTWYDETPKRNQGPGSDDVQDIGVWPAVKIREVVEGPVDPSAVRPHENRGQSNVEFPIPMGCSCKDVEIGSYANQVELPTPQHMLDLGQIGCLSFRPTTCVDRCIAPAVQALWALGVVTTGCCCGHNVRDGYIGIWVPKC